ncbi:hypothetical protein POM88_038807 [Heracleum sosnowskyi]|uniref:Uncharacterized protein n=1 Tax=Heracleum sosnowskyi TaxID=360622 RepID=A0AAD8HAA0_9APIA|nr:hypothetical protein POM88_038807 [Heracleum sosnowskyi]
MLVGFLCPSFIQDEATKLSTQGRKCTDCLLLKFLGATSNFDLSILNGEGSNVKGSQRKTGECGLLSLRTEDCLLYAFSVAGIVLSVVAYDYQEIGVLVTLFCLFHACVGLILPSLARLRTLYVPNELRGGMMSLSLVPVSAAILFFLMQGGYYRNIENSTIIAFAALGLFSAAGSMYLLK